MFQLPLCDVFEKIIDNILQSRIEMSSKLDSVIKEQEMLEKGNWDAL